MEWEGGWGVFWGCVQAGGRGSHLKRRGEVDGRESWKE